MGMVIAFVFLAGLFGGALVSVAGVFLYLSARKRRKSGLLFILLALLASGAIVAAALFFHGPTTPSGSGAPTGDDFQAFFITAGLLGSAPGLGTLASGFLVLIRALVAPQPPAR